MRESYYQRHKEKIKEYSKNYNKSRGEKYKEYQRKYRQEHKDQLNEWNRNYYQEHKEQENARHRKWNQDHKEKIKKYKYESYKRYQLKNPFRSWAKISLASHRKREFEIKITIDELEQLAKLAPRCPYCDKKINYIPRNGKVSLDSATLDRINNEKVLTINNVKILCHQCNTSKGNRTEKEFFEFCQKLIEKFNIK